MKCVGVLCLLSVVAMVAARPETYTDRFDNINLQEIINNHRLLKAYINCVLEKGKCTNEGRELKTHIKDAIENRCDKCTEAQRNGTKTVIRHLINHEPASWEELVQKYDPERKYVVKYETELREVLKE
ncbi:unnamed protein product [Danaus chrysippus]|uniref:(African queen) hypothetical protein n=1 Tax=Danaus chrysippus TaxID=151541 RepID=A0A8J2QIT6_9NEOP|nr:unnamed protein product [Danaus chrysippus]